MFGYVVPDKPNMFVKDYYLYKAYYCGLCKSIGKHCGQCMRLSTNYDMTFLSILMHDILQCKVEFAKEACILSPKKKSIVKDDKLTQTIVDINTMLFYYKVCDNIIDNESAAKYKFINFVLLNKHYKKAKNKLPKIDEIIKKGYDNLRVQEKANCASPDKVAHPFANMLAQLGQEVLQEKCTESIKVFMYNIGKWIYLVDAIDDIAQDFKDKSYNVFLVDYNFISKEQFLQDKKETLELILFGCYNIIKENYANITLADNNGVVTNIVWYGLLQRTKEILRSIEKCKQTRI
ncbi:MAG: DUF5685 family protein [Clostridia bacterium]